MVDSILGNAALAGLPVLPCAEGATIYDVHMRLCGVMSSSL
jgi:hypothetical protein